MNEPQLRLDNGEYSINTQTLFPGKKNYEFCKANEVGVFQIIIG